MDEPELLDVAVEAALAAGAELLTRFRSEGLGVRTKSTDTDPVTEADLAAERAIRAVLAARRPDDSILGEEGGATGGSSELQWIVDPLDGTVNYLYGIAQWAVSVACVDGDGGVVGVVLNPVSGECFTASRSGAPLLGDAVVVGSSCTDLSHALVATGFGYDPAVRSTQAAVVSRLLPLARDIRRAGAAALDLAYCACGRVDAYYERGVKAWDIAAGSLLCSRAGLAVRTLDAVDELPLGIAVAPPALIDEFVALVA